MIVLVVEDHDFQRSMIMRMLHSLGVEEVLEAADGRQALDILTARPVVDAVVCDLDMPDIDGMEFIRCLGETGSRLSLVISSAQEPNVVSSVETMARAYGVRVLGSVQKPVSLSSLSGLLAHVGTPEPGAAHAAASIFELDEIVTALHRDEFEPFFQPKVELATGRISGAEGLARWRNPEHGLVGPDRFIPALQSNGHIGQLTEMMMAKSAAACRRWCDRGWDLSVSVNISPATLGDTGLAERLVQIVRDAGIDPARVILEVTETVAIGNMGPALENLTRLRMRGFGLAIDDYGTGHATLQQLMRIPFTELKIDRAFVSNLVQDAGAHAVCLSCVEIARRLQITCVAEGVETQEEWDALKDAGCHIAQGYLLSPPVEEAAFVEFCSTSV